MKIEIYKNDNIQPLCLDVEGTIEEAARIIRSHPGRTAIVVDEYKELIGLVTDTNIRMAILSDRKLTDPLKYCMQTSPNFDREGKDPAHYMKIMIDSQLNELPLVDENNISQGLACLEYRWEQEKEHPLVVLMAGGLGTRLSPLTDQMPKPMIDINGKPLLERLLQQFKNFGFRNFAISVNYLPHVIEDYFGTGEEFGVSIRYIRETKKLGTAGCLSLIDVEDHTPVFIINGDVLTNLDLRSMMNFHEAGNSQATIAVNTYSEQILYGVISVKNNVVTKIEEKPIINFLANSGIYIVKGQNLSLLKPNEYMDMPNFLNDMSKNSTEVRAFPIHEYWQDIGNTRDLEKARKDFSSGL